MNAGFLSMSPVEKYKGIQIMMDYKQERIMTLGELTPEWWIG